MTSFAKVNLRGGYNATSASPSSSLNKIALRHSHLRSRRGDGDDDDKDDNRSLGKKFEKRVMRTSISSTKASSQHRRIVYDGNPFPPKETPKVPSTPLRPKRSPNGSLVTVATVSKTSTKELQRLAPPPPQPSNDDVVTTINAKRSHKKKSTEDLLRVRTKTRAQRAQSKMHALETYLSAMESKLATVPDTDMDARTAIEQRMASIKDKLQGQINALV